MKILTLMILMTFSGMTFANEPEEVLEGYFQVLTERDFTDLSKLMSARSMSDLKALVVRAIKYQASQGSFRLQRRFFDGKMTTEQIENTPAEHFLNVLAAEVLNAADATHFVVASESILGRVIEGEDVVHVVARLGLVQDDHSTSDVMLYTLVREDGDWKLTFPPTFKQILAVLEASYRQI